MRPYYATDRVRLYHGDCLDLRVPCDLIVSDPPYGQALSFSRIAREAHWRTIHLDDDPEAVERRLAHALRDLRINRHVYLFSGRLRTDRLRLASPVELVWDKVSMGLGNLSLPWGPQHEIILFGVHVAPSVVKSGRGGGLSARLRRGSVLRSQRANSRGARHHPTEKPVDILRQMIESSSLVNEVVYDPFCGSGSTLIAAANEGRRAVGCEIDERHCETAARRLEREVTDRYLARLESYARRLRRALERAR